VVGCGHVLLTVLIGPQVEVLRHLATPCHDNVVRLLAAFRAPSQGEEPGESQHKGEGRGAQGEKGPEGENSGACWGREQNAIYLVFEKMESDLSHFIRIRRGQLRQFHRISVMFHLFSIISLSLSLSLSLSQLSRDHGLHLPDTLGSTVIA